MMTTQNDNPTPTQDQIGGRSCIQVLSLIVFLWGALMMFPKTVDLLSKFSPDEFLGYVGLAAYWAMGSALLIEGVMVVMKIKTWISPARNLIEWGWDAILTLIPYILSMLAQIFDGMVVRETITQQPEEIQLLITFLVPALPGLMIGLLSIFALVESAPPGMFGGATVGNAAGGIKLPKLPSVGKLPWRLNPVNWFDKKPPVLAKSLPPSDHTSVANMVGAGGQSDRIEPAATGDKTVNPTPLPTPQGKTE